MYLKNGLISFLKVKNVILLILGIFFTAASASNMIELIVYYFGDWFTIIRANSTLGSVFLFIIGVLMIVCSRISRRLINDACFFSSYFEGDLNGYVDFAELAEVTGRITPQIKSRIALLHLLYMKNFRVIKTVNYRYPEIIELYSKTVTCSCRSCGGWMEKRVYFTGVCPFCGSSDLTAQVVSEQRYYYINDNASEKPSDPNYYFGKNLRSKHIRYAVAFGVALFFMIILLIVFLTTVNNYHNDAYFKDIVGRSDPNFRVIHSDLDNVIIFTVFAMVAVFSAFPLTLARLSSIETAESFAKLFAKTPNPFVTLDQLALTVPESFRKTDSVSLAKWYKNVVKAIKDGFLCGCNPEKHSGELRIALSKQIVKDRCPGCGAPITDAVTENYSCRFCGRVITGVIRKQ